MRERLARQMPRDFEIRPCSMRAAEGLSMLARGPISAVSTRDGLPIDSLAASARRLASIYGEASAALLGDFSGGGAELPMLRRCWRVDVTESAIYRERFYYYIAARAPLSISRRATICRLMQPMLFCYLIFTVMRHRGAFAASGRCSAWRRAI